MANKKCPKCGEDNPAEAVMCWACYTPLTAGAGAAMATATMGGAGAATLPRPGGPLGATGAPNEGEKKKEIDPKLFVLGGLILVAVIAVLFQMGVFGGSTPETVPETPVDGGDRAGSFPSTNSNTNTQPPSAPVGGGSTGVDPNAGAGAATRPAPYSMIISPNPAYTTATFGIVPTQPNASDAVALRLAKSARESVGRGGKWQRMQIFVFSDAASASSFRTMMSSRRGAPLSPQDFASNSGAFNGAILYYQSSGKGGGTYTSPAKNPNGAWWGAR